MILIFMGMNGRGRGVPLRPACEEKKNDLTVFSEAYAEMLRKLRANAPSAELWCLTLPLASHDGYAPSEAARRRTEAYSNVIAECAVRNACRLIDICHMEPYESFDGLHPNAKGMRQISDAVLSAWKKG